jgi:predicted Zn-dependent protease
MRGAGFRQLEGERTTLNGLEAHVGLYQGQIQGLGEVVSRAAHIRHNNAYYLVPGLVSSNVFRQVDATFLGSIRSFRPLSAAEAAAIRPQRLNLYVVRAGDTWASIAERSAGAEARQLGGDEPRRPKLAAARRNPNQNRGCRLMRGRPTQVQAGAALGVRR